MKAYPFYINMMFLMLLATAEATLRFPVQIANQYALLVNPLQACHNAAIQYADANPGVTCPTTPGCSANLIRGYLAPGVTDPNIANPGTYTYLITAPGTVTTYLTTPITVQSTVITTLQNLAHYQVMAGVVSGGNIVPLQPEQPYPVATGVPNGVIAIQTIVRNH